MENKTKKIIITIVSIIAVAILGSIFVNIGMAWFNATTKPSQWIPNFVIPIVWSVIYILFAIVFVKLINNNQFTKPIMILAIINGIMNILWCLVFFTFNLTFLGNIIILINTIFGYLLYIEIMKTDKIASYMIALYPIWLTIASTLNLAIWILN